jgi:hypothetical protein
MRSETSEPPELHALACFVHGALTALHVLGAVYNCRRRNWWDVTAHLAAAGYDARSVRHHYRVEQIARMRQSSRSRPDRGDTSPHLSEYPAAPRDHRDRPCCDAGTITPKIIVPVTPVQLPLEPGRP